MSGLALIGGSITCEGCGVVCGLLYIRNAWNENCLHSGALKLKLLENISIYTPPIT
jgi:hypothetical protein